MGIEEEYGKVATTDAQPSLHVLGVAIGVPNEMSAGPCGVSVLFIVGSVEFTGKILE